MHPAPSEKKALLRTGTVYRLVCICVCFVNIHAAANDTTGCYFGAKIGAGTTYLTHHHLYMLGNSRIAFTIGFTGEYRFKKRFSARLSMEYTHKGGGMLSPRLFYAKDDPILGIPESGQTLHATNLTVHTIEIPVTVCFYLPLKGAFHPFVLAGPSFGHNFYARADNYFLWAFDGAPNDLLDETSDFVIDRIKPWNISVYTGLGTEIDTGKKIIFETGITFRLGMTYEDRFFETLYHKYSSVSTFVYIGMKF
jgi:hypothetical protein